MEDCKFGYRDSIFKTSAKGKYVIVEVTFKLTTQNHHIKTEYGAISTELKNLELKILLFKRFLKRLLISDKANCPILPKLETLEVSSKTQAFL